jgi:hypothetical protein
MNAADCTPVSWLRLERYMLGELAAGERDDVAAHLASCARCRACADRVASDARRELPPLPAVVPTAAPSPSPARAAVSRWPWKIRPRAFALAAAIGAFGLVLVLRPGAQREQALVVHGPRVVAVKGGDVSIELVRERGGSIAWEPTSFAPADRFKVLVTCAPPLQLHTDIVVLQSDGAAFPGEPAAISCGNRVPVPPAFSITGPGDATICVGLDPSGPPSRATLAVGEGARIAHACLRLDRRE